MTKKQLLSFVRRAVQDYSMIDSGDRIAVGVSGGKDSLLLLWALASLARFYPAPFSLCAITVDLGFPGADFSETRRLCAELDVPLTVEKTEIGRVIFDERREHNPCSLCSKMRRGALARAAKRENCNKLALGHHRDDVIETLLLNLFYAGKLATFEPKSFLDRSQLTLIRPLLYLEERDILYFCNQNGIHPDESGCPANEKTHREEMKTLIRTLSHENRDLPSKLFGAICRAQLNGFTAPPPAGKR